MKSAIFIITFTLSCVTLMACRQYPEAPILTLSSVDGTTIDLDAGTPLTALFFFSVSNPVALGALDKLPERLDDAADSVAIAMHVDRPPNVDYIQQRTLVPIVIDDASHIANAFGGIELTPALILIDKGRILLKQRGNLDYDAINTAIENAL